MGGRLARNHKRHKNKTRKGTKKKYLIAATACLCLLCPKVCAFLRLKLDTLLGPNSRGKWMLYLCDFRYQVRRFDELRRGVPTGNYNV